jgi:hypothetical protein
MVGFAQAGVLAGVKQRSLRDHARTAKWHLAEASDGSPLICLESLTTSGGSTQRFSLIPEKRNNQ